MALWEITSPRRLLAIGRGPRWASNLGILLVDVLAVRILLPTAATGAAQARKSTWSRLHSARTIAGVWQMRTLPLALGLALVLALVSSPGPTVAPLIGVAAAQVPDDVYRKCRKAVFRKYGYRETRDERRKLAMPSGTATQSVDQCVANGGRVM